MAGNPSDKTVSNMTVTEFANSIADGVATAFYRMEDRQALLDQQAEQSGAAKKNNPIETISQNIEQMKENNNAIVGLFRDMSESLSMMQMRTSVEEPVMGSELARRASNSAFNEMALSESVPMSTGTVGNALRNFSMSNAVSQPTMSAVNTGDAYQQAIMSTGAAVERNSEATDKKALADEEERAYRDAVRPVMPKLNRALDLFLEQQSSSVSNMGSDAGGGLLKLLAALGGGLVGFAAGYLGKFMGMWGEVSKSFTSAINAGWTKLKNSKIGKTIGSIGSKIKGAVKNGIKEIGKLGDSIRDAIGAGIGKVKSLKSTFSSVVRGMKKSLSESMVGKVAKSVGDRVKSAGKFIGNMASKVGSGLKVAAKAVANSTAVKAAMSAARTGAKIAKKLPAVQAAVGVADTISNTYKIAKAGGGMSDIMNTAAAGLVDTLSDTLLIPELVNAAGGAIAAVKSGGGFGDIVKGAGSGFMKQREANDISIGNGLMANLQNFIGNGNESTRRIAAAYNAGKGYDAAGMRVVSGTAGGFGHSAAMLVPMGAGSLANSRTPTAKVADNLPNGAQMSEADKLKAIRDGMRDGVKEAMLSPEVQEANSRNAKETGAAINGQLFGGG